jgi:hypothetical protein
MLSVQSLKRIVQRDTIKIANNMPYRFQHAIVGRRTIAGTKFVLLPFTRGQAITLSAFRGRWIWKAFGFIATLLVKDTRLAGVQLQDTLLQTRATSVFPPSSWDIAIRIEFACFADFSLTSIGAAITKHAIWTHFSICT